MSRDSRRRLSILYEDDEILVIDKPAGLLTIPSDPARAPFEDTVLKRVRNTSRGRGVRGRTSACCIVWIAIRPARWRSR